MRRFIPILLVLLPACTSSHPALPPLTASTAATRALALLSLPGARVISTTPMPHRDDLVPFPIPPGTLWNVHLDNITLRQDGESPNPSIHSLNVLLASNGQLVEIRSPTPPGITPFPSAAQYAQQLPSVGDAYSPLSPAAAINTPFPAAIAHSNAIAGARQVIIYLANVQTVMWKTPRPAWIVHAWAIPPFQPIGGPDPTNVPPDARNHLRTLIDATTGQPAGSDTTPQPQ